MAIAKLDRARPPELCGQNLHYITREGATDSIDFHNLDSLDAGDIEERRAAGIAYAETREIDGRARQRIKNSKPKINHKTGREVATRQDRNHSTLILSWDRTESTDKARQMTKEFLEKEFKNARAIFTIHTDKVGQTHAHVWIDNRLENGKKLQIPQKQFYSLDERWAQRYDREYGTDYAPRFKELKRETLEWKREAAQAKERGEEFDKPKPVRANDLVKGKVKEKMVARELQNVGEREHDEERNNRDKQFVTVGHSAIDSAKQEMDGAKRTVDGAARVFEQSKHSFADSKLALAERADSGERAEQAAGAAVRSIDESIGRSNQLPTQVRTRSLDRDERDDGRGR